MKRRSRIIATFACVALAATGFAQGPASCGYHLDVRADLTSSHSAIADMPNAPGSGGAFMAPATPGNPYTAFATPGSPMAMTISANPLAYGPAPLGPGSCATIFYSIGPPPPVPIVVPATFVPPCLGPAFPIIAGILPITGVIVDSCGFLAPPTPFGLWDMPPGTGRWTVTGGYPPFAPPVSFQAAGIAPNGLIWVTNAVTVFPGASPFEIPVPAPVPCGLPAPTDDGASVGNPVPAGFAFYGFPQPFVDIDTNGFVDFAAGNGGAAQPCDTTGSAGDLGCAPVTPTARPRVDVNHANYDFGVPLAAPFLPMMTVETRPPGPTWPDAVIYRWKNAPPIGSPAATPGLATDALVLELQGSQCVPCAAFVPNRIVVVRSWVNVPDQVGVGPGPGTPPFFPYPAPPAGPTCALGPGGLPFMGTFAPPAGAPFPSPPGGVVHMNLATSSAAVLNSAIVFTPMMMPAPDGYLLTVH